MGKVSRPFHETVRVRTKSKYHRGSRNHWLVKMSRSQFLLVRRVAGNPPKGGRRGSAELDGAVKSLLAEYAAGDTELAEALDALMEIRAAKKAVDSTRAVTTLLNRLNRLSDNSREVKLQILEQSVTSWKGIFPLKGGQAQTRKEPKRYVE